MAIGAPQCHRWADGDLLARRCRHGARLEHQVLLAGDSAQESGEHRRHGAELRQRGLGPVEVRLALLLPCPHNCPLTIPMNRSSWLGSSEAPSAAWYACSMVKYGN